MADTQYKIIQRVGNSTLFSGTFNGTGDHSNLVACLITSLDNTVFFESSDFSLHAKSMLISPGVSHRIDFHSAQALVLYLEHICLNVDCSDYESTTVPAVPVSSDVSSKVLVNRHTWSNEAATWVCDKLEMREARIDEPIRRIVRSIKANPMNRMTQVKATALANLERTTMLKRFKKSTGMSFRRFKIWEATKYAIERYQDGGSIESAALDAGFYDASHFSRTFRSLFGFSPIKAIETDD